MNHFPCLSTSIELTNLCNLDCTMCQRRNMKRTHGHMDLNLLKKIIDQKFPISWFHQWGEPLLYPHLREVLEYFKHNGQGDGATDGAISTNAILMNKAKREILLENANMVLCCVDSARPNAYNKIRNNKHYDLVCENIRKLIEEKIKTNSPCKIFIQLLRTIYNSDENIQELINMFGSVPLYRETECRKHVYGQDISLKDPKRNPDHDSKIECAKKAELIILWNGDCMNCCWDFDGEDCIGNANETSLIDIWEGARRRDFEHRMENKKFSKVCDKCLGPYLA